MNELLKAYVIDSEFPDVSGIEHIDMLHTRSELAEIEASLTGEERHLLTEADARLVMHAAQFWAELRRFIDLAEERHRRNTPPSQWWWYLDVLAQAPAVGSAEFTAIAV